MVDLTTATHVCGGCGTYYNGHQGNCVECFRTGSLMPVRSRPVASMLPAQRGFSAAELVRHNTRKVHSKAYPDISLGVSSMVVVYGAPGAGKSTFALKFAAGFDSSIYYSLEMGAGPLMADMLRRLDIRSQGLWVEPAGSAQRMLELAAGKEPCLVVDSGTICTVLPDDWQRVARENSKVVLVLLQVTKAGDFAGSMSWAHDADVVIKVDSMKWVIEKSRYQAGGSGWVIEPVPEVCDESR